ncbi:RNA cytidine acetyltransferase isoform X2 [Chrysoperla carnea]|uniref:RNA cytidine acetyltransferase isoform X2 n=1 Tax=Chrysoperla carnea TaxID=189513 RepID=UPI001D085FCE|nr:RNA cytidine acetyltransferase isoform X2 [Chrysoperla carnea]
MVRKKIDNRIRVLIENGVTLGHRTMFVVVGDKGRDQVVILHHMLSKSTVKTRPSVLWCYSKELGFSSHRKKRMKHIQKKLQAGKLSVNEDDPFELFVSSTNIRYCYYSETHKILGKTYGMCVLQDFEALTPNLLARTIETVEGGGVIVILLRTMSSLKQLYTMNMDVHKRFRTEAHRDVVCRFNERFLLSLTSSKRCLVVDDSLNVLPISSHNLAVEPVSKSTEQSDNDLQLEDLKINLRDTQPAGSLVECCKTLDQAKALLKFIEAISEKTLRSTVSLTASRGRGKSAALGLAIAAAVGCGYSNIFVTSPSPENLNTFFEFVFKGFDALNYQEHLDYDLVESTNPEFNKAIVRVNIFHDHRQTIQYIHPTDAHRLSQAELLVIDEAAAIPLPYVKAMLGPYLVFLASTINGYEGTGRSLSLKLLQQLRTQTSPLGITNMESAQKKSMAATSGRILHEITLEESIRYKPGDDIEKWLTQLLCLDANTVSPILSGCPPPDSCDLYYVNRDTLFCYHKHSEAFLQRIVSLYVASHYKNSPNDLQMLSDAPAHHIFCLLGPVDPNRKSLPEVLVVIQICLEGQISKSSINDSMARGKRPSGDLIPWTIAQQYQDPDFPMLSGARIVRIATHPDYQSMGYGNRAIELLKAYFEYKIPNIDEDLNVPDEIENVSDSEVGLLEEEIKPRKALPPLLLKLSERTPEKLDYIGVSFGLTQPLLKFWKKVGFVPIYLRQTTNDLTGEHSCIMVRLINQEDSKETSWLNGFWKDFRRRFISLLSYQFRTFAPGLAMGILVNKSLTLENSSMTQQELDVYMTKYDIKRLEMYSKNLVDYHLIMDLLPTLGRIYYLNQMGDVHMSALESAILLGLGLQHKTVEDLSTELGIPSTQLLGTFNKIVRRCVQFLNNIMEQTIERTLINPHNTRHDETLDKMMPVRQSMAEELEEAAKELQIKQKKQLDKLKKENLSQFKIKGSEDEWNKVLTKGGKGIISIKSETDLTEGLSTVHIHDEKSEKND